MQVDNLTRALLAAILVCLLIVLGQGYRSGFGAGDLAAASASPERFHVHTIVLLRGAPLLLRSDTATGQAWRMGLMDAGRWEPLAEGPEGIPSPEATRPGRYSITPVAQRRGAPTLVRVDGVDGRTWRRASKGGGTWVLVPNPGDQASAGEPAAEAATP
jgi:hypothetical protein